MPDTIISALFAFFGAALGSGIAAFATLKAEKLSAESDLRLKSFELFFHEKAVAYKEFLHACDSYLRFSSSPQAITNLHEASSNAILFSSDDMETAIMAYGDLLSKSKFPNCSSEKTLELTRARTEIILAMQSELKGQTVPKKKRHQKSSKKPDSKQ